LWRWHAAYSTKDRKSAPGRAETRTIDETDQLLERLAAGDRRALARVTRIIGARLRRLGAYDLRSDWEDLSQEVVWALVRSVREDRAPATGRVAAYIGSVVYNQFVSRLRRRNAHPDERGDSFDEETTMACPTSLFGAESTREERLAARLALATLGEDQQELLVAHHVEGRSVEMLVAAMRRSRASVNRDLKRARQAFRDAVLGVGGDTRYEADRTSDAASSPRSSIHRNPR
jgi:RNA polymerase sigma factor (sigma-70 family)